MIKKTTFIIAILSIFYGNAQVNLSLTGTTSTNATADSSANAIDGNTGTRWESDFDDDQ